jgi:hypothetical protein
MPEKRVGGSFAPPLTTEKLDAYAGLHDGIEDPVVKYVFGNLLACAKKFQETGESKEKPVPHPMDGAEVQTSDGKTGVLRAKVVPLEKAEIDRIWDDVPWPYECDAYGQQLDVLPPGELRNAAYHLLWYARELTADREPMTTDRVRIE